MLLPLDTRATVTASGGALTNDFGAFRYHVFTNTGPMDFDVTEGGDVEVLIVAGGGGGGGSAGSGASGAGGGAGGLILTTVIAQSGSNYTITVGAGGDSTGPSDDEPGGDGDDSVAFGLTAIGGGGGGSRASGDADGRGGGSGGGVGSHQVGGEGEGLQPGSTSGGYGHDGGDSGFGGNTGHQNASGGGGGAGGPGGDGLDNDDSGDGGEGIDLSDWLGNLELGDDGWFAGGGGGGRAGSTADSFGKGSGGGKGGGADGGDTVAVNAMPNTGGGGGGAGRNGAPSDGGSGIVVVRYVVADTPLDVIVQAATGVADTNATFNGRVLGTDGEADPDAYFCWGPSDGGTGSTGDWYRVISMGTRQAGEYFSHETFDLDTGQHYYVRAYVTNSAGQTAWSGLMEFSTLGFPDISNDGLLWTSRRKANVAGTLTDDGGEPSLTWAEYWPTDAGSPTFTTAIGTLTTGESFDAILEDMAPATAYTFRFAASNAVGIVHSGEDSLTTHSADPFAWYVATNGNHSAGTNWATAWNDVQHALDMTEPGDEVYLAGQVFGGEPDLAGSEAFVIANITNIKIRGGFRAAEADNADLPGTNNAAIWSTVLTSDGTKRVLAVANSVSGRIENVTISGGALSGNINGGGVHISDSTDFQFWSCLIVSNDAGPATGTSRGGGLYTINSSVLIADSLIQGNRAQASGHGQGYGGGLHLASGSLTVSNSVIRENSAEHSGSRGGGVYLHAGNMILMDTLISANDTTPGSGTGWGGGIYNLGNMVLRNCLLYFNVADPGQWGGVYSSGSGAMLTVENVTIADNIGGGIYRNGGGMSLTNAIVWNNGDLDTGGGVGPVHSLIGSGDTEGPGCISDNPLFEFGYYLGAGSPAIDAGTNATWLLDSIYTTQADGAPDSGVVDMGYHYRSGADLTYADIYVSEATGNNANSGTNALQPFETITYALTKAIPGSRIHIAPGHYVHGRETFPLEIIQFSSIQLLGTDAETTIIDADGSNARVLTWEGVGNGRIESVTLTGGNVPSGGGHGGGMRIADSAMITVVSNRFIDNKTVSGGRSYGGGLYAESSGVLIEACFFGWNQANGSGHGDGHGGGMALRGGSMHIRNSVIVSNRAHHTGRTGGGLYLESGAMTVLNSMIGGNYATEGSGSSAGGGGVRNDAGTLTMRNCLIAENRSEQVGDGMITTGNGLTVLENCSFAHNDLVENGSEGIRRNAGTLIMTNTIVWGHADDLIGVDENLIWYSCAASLTPGIQGNIAGDPLFVDAAGGNYRLQKNISPAIDAGINLDWMQAAVCLDGNERILYGRKSVTVDMGAYETLPVPGSMFMFR